MKHFRNSKKLLPLLLITTVSFSGFGQNRSIEFVEGKWGDILAKAKESNKIIFFDAYTVWCGPCKKLAKEIFTRDEVADFYNENFICVHFDMEKDEGIILAKRYKVKAYPSLLFIDGEGRDVHRFVGAPKYPHEFIRIGEIALNPTERLAYFQDHYDNGNLEGEFILKYLNKLTTAYIPRDPIIKKYFDTQHDSQLTTRANWEIIYYHVNKINSREFKYLLNNQKDYKVLYNEDSVNNKIYTTFLQQAYKLIYSREFEPEKYESLKNKIRKADFALGEQLIITADLQYYSRYNKWKDYTELAYNNVDKFYLEDHNTLNNIAWNVCQNTNKKEYLNKAEEWAKKSVELNSKSFNNDTYAAILYKVGKKEEAIKQQELAIELAKEEGRPTKSFEEKLDKMKK